MDFLTGLLIGCGGTLALGNLLNWLAERREGRKDPQNG